MNRMGILQMGIYGSIIFEFFLYKSMQFLHLVFDCLLLKGICSLMIQKVLSFLFFTSNMLSDSSVYEKTQLT